MQIGQNIKAELKGETLTLTIDTSQDNGASKTGKTRRIASSLGNKELELLPGVYLGLNIYRK